MKISGMKISGIICEYNPLHNGHLHHIRTVRENGADAIVAVMSGNFMQRGDVAIMEKLTRAQLALRAGADLVIELPVIWSLAPADRFAAGGVALLNALQVVDEISFGAECADLELLQTAANVCRTCQTEYADTLRMFTRQGNSYPAVMQELATNLAGEEVSSVLSQPNNTLAIAYLNAIADQGCWISPFPVQRKGAGHNSTGAVPMTSGEENAPETNILRPEPMPKSIASASYIRNCVEKGIDCRHMMPHDSWKALSKARKNGTSGSMKNLERIILYTLRTMSSEQIASFGEVGAQGLAGHIYNSRAASSLDELLQMLTTKRYPLSRLRRILLHMLIGITNEDIYSLPPYGRILAFNTTGRKVLAHSKHMRSLPFGESLKWLSTQGPAAKRCAMLEARATDIYQLACNTIGPAGSDYRHKITLTNTAE